MDKKICMITGANSGIGKAAATQIAQQGYHTILARRNPERGKTALREIEENSHSASLELMIVDMSLQSSIRGLSKKCCHKYGKLDVFIHNAAIFDITQKDVVYTSEGIEAVWATNHLGPSLLTELLLDAITKQ